MNHPMLILFGTLTWGCTNSKGASATSEPSSTEAADSATQDPGEPDDTGVHPAPGDSGHSNPQDTPPEDTSGGTAPHDTSGPDTSVPETEFGTISGDCGVLSLPSDSSRLIHNKIDFGSTPFDTEWLSAGGAEIFAEGTLGGSSIHSEVMAFEVLHRCEGGALLKSETEISYIDPMGKKTDMLLSIDGVAVGVSVTRAFKWGEDVVYAVDDAVSLLSDKLSDVLLSQANADPADAWSHSILHVMTHDASYLPSLETAYAGLSTDLTGETIVLFTVTDGDDGFIY